MDDGSKQRADLHPLQLELVRHWLTQCRGNDLPMRAGVDLDELRPALRAHLALVDIVESGTRLMFRFCGADLAEAAGMDLTGRMVHRLNPDKPYAAYIEALYDRCQVSRRPVFSKCSYSLRRSPATLFTRRLICPLGGDSGAVVGFIAAQTFDLRGDGDHPSLVHHDHFVPGQVAVL